MNPAPKKLSLNVALPLPTLESSIDLTDPRSSYQRLRDRMIQYQNLLLYNGV